MLLRLRQACDHPFLVKGYHSMDSAGEASVKTAEKLPKDQLMNLLNMLEASLAICGICNDESESRGRRSGEMLKQRKRKYQEENEPEHMPSSEPMMPNIPILHTQEPGAKDNDVHHTSVKDLHGNDVHIGNLSSCSEAHITRVESLEVGELVEEPAVATMNTSFPNCRAHDSTSLIVPTSTDAIPSLKGSTSASAQESVGEFVFVDNFKIPKEYEILYKKVHGKYGHIATKKVIKSSDTVLVACVSDLLRIISAMETKRGVELSEELLKEWEGIIKDAEALKFNVRWFREGFDRLKSQWMSDSDEQVLDAMQGEYVGLCTRKDQLETDLSEVKIQMKKAEAKISSKREAIREKQTQKFIFQNEPVLRIVLN